METPYRVLIIEDNPADAELIEREVRMALDNCICIRVDNEVDFLKALDEFVPDIILSDYMMPSFDGMSALKLTLEKAPLTPFIIVTGSINEETAVDCMKAGATDYVIKQSIKRLGPAIEHAIEEKNIRFEKLKMQEELRKSEERLRTIVNSSPNIIFILKEGIILFVNEIITDLLGYFKDEVIGKNINEFLSDNSKDLMQIKMRRRLVDKEIIPYEIEVIAKSGDIKYFLVNASVIPYEEESAILVILSDITKRKQAEQEIQKRIKELEDFYEIAIGRELRIKELKETIEKLEEEIAKYKKRNID